MKRALALIAFTSLAACAPSDPAAFAEQQWTICQGGFAYEEQRLQACSEVIASPAADASRRAEALVLRGSLRADSAQDARAAADFGRALRIDPTMVRAYIERGQMHFSRDAFESAIRDYDRALEIHPGWEEALSLRDAAMRASAEGRMSQLEILTRALAERPQDDALWNNRCWLRAVSGEELEFALADCNEAIRLNPRSSEAYDSRGLVNLKRGDNAAALSDYEAALRLAPGSGHYLYGRGVARMRLGQPEAARADFTAAERAEPGIASTYQGYGVSI